MRLLADTFNWELRGEPMPFDGICTDSRQLRPGQLFVALRGENHDAQAFVAQALKEGAAGAVVSEAVTDVEPLLIADDTQVALGQVAALHRASFAGELFAITGSAGKTSTKEMLAAILAQAGPVLATEGNLNNEIGVPLTLLRLRQEHRYAVIEMGAAKPGDIRYLVDIARPGTSILTNAMPAHLQGFGDLERVAQTKGEIFVAEPDCVAVINLDDHYAGLWRELAEGARVVGFSAAGKADADVRAARVEAGPDGSHFLLQSAAGDCTVRLSVPGIHNVANALAAAAAALSRDISLDAVQAGLNSFGGVAGRLQFLQGKGGQLVIDDSYNANPQAVRSALDVLARQSGRKAFVFGDMAELGERSAELHSELGRYARDCGIDLLLAVGARAAQSAAAFGAPAQAFRDLAELQQWLGQHDFPAEYPVCLVKGSRSARMELAVAMLVESGGAH